jgi:3-hydroxypropanoate dehydrogenase
MKIIEENVWNQAFDHARTYNEWQEKPVEDGLLKELYDHVKWGPTSANCLPLRIIFVKSKASKEALKPSLMEGNVDKTMGAPITAILAQNIEFYNDFGRLFPVADAKSWFLGNERLIYDTALRNTSLQAGYFIIAARMLGLDCGPMSGFDGALLKKTFFSDKPWEASLLCNLGYGKPESTHPRLDRFSFEEVCQVI